MVGMYPQLDNSNDLGSRIRQKLASIPMCTCYVMLICIFVELLSWVIPALTSEGMLCAGSVVYRLQVYRLLTAAFLHSGVIHLMMNMFALVSVGRHVEVKLGTLTMTGLVFGFTLSAHLLYVLVMVFVALLSGSSAPLYSCAIGFSGVLFGLMVVDSALRDDSPRRVFFFTVPASSYPWVMLFLVTLFLPGSSFLGHLCGLVLGICYVNGWLNALTPSRARLSAFERGLSVSSNPQFLRIPDVSPLRVPVADWSPDRRQTFWQRLSTAVSRAGAPAQAYQPVSQHGDGLFVGKGYTLGSVSHSPTTQHAVDLASSPSNLDAVPLESWACLRCTFINPASMTVCKMCSSLPGPLPSVIPAPSAPLYSSSEPSAPPPYSPTELSAQPEQISEPVQSGSSPIGGKTNVANVSRLLQPH